MTRGILRGILALSAGSLCPPTKHFRRIGMKTEARKIVHKVDESPMFWGFIDDYDYIVDFFIPVKVGSGGCISQTCIHWSHDPEAPLYRLAPRENVQLSLLSENSRESYYSVNDEWVMKITHSIGRHDKIEFVESLDYLPIEVVERLSE
ncbi:MAG: hypothetical protein QW328_09085 [Nitrososphaerota archaeon]